MMMRYADAVEEFGSGLADMMLECEYNEFIRGCTPHKKSLDEIETMVQRIVSDNKKRLKEENKNSQSND